MKIRTERPKLNNLTAFTEHSWQALRFVVWDALTLHSKRFSVKRAAMANISKNLKSDPYVADTAAAYEEVLYRRARFIDRIERMLPRQLSGRPLSDHERHQLERFTICTPVVTHVPDWNGNSHRCGLPFCPFCRFRSIMRALEYKHSTRTVKRYVKYYFTHMINPERFASLMKVVQLDRGKLRKALNPSINPPYPHDALLHGTRLDLGWSEPKESVSVKGRTSRQFGFVLSSTVLYPDLPELPWSTNKVKDEGWAMDKMEYWQAACRMFRFKLFNLYDPWGRCLQTLSLNSYDKIYSAFKMLHDA